MFPIFKLAFCTGIILLFNQSKLHAQYQASRYEFGIGAGTLIYQGDLSPAYVGHYKALRPSLGLSSSRKLTNQLSVGLHLYFGKLLTDETIYNEPSWRKERAFSFNSRMAEISALASWNLLRTDQFYQPRLSPYIFAGTGISYLNTSKDWSRVNTLVFEEGSDVQQGLAIDTLVSPDRFIAVVPIGIGATYRLNAQVSLSARINYRFTTSDYVDGFKYSGNEETKDSYYGITIGILYRFGHYDCPPVK